MPTLTNIDMAEGPANKKSKTYYFHPEWEHEFLFTSANEKTICLICQQAVALPKRGNLERHHATTHAKFKDLYPLNSALRSKRIDELKRGLKAQQSLFIAPTAKGKAATETSFRVSHILAKHKKPFTDGELIKEAMSVTADTLFADFKNKEDISAKIKSVPLGAPTVARRVESLSEDVSLQVLKDLSICEYFSLQFDESTDATDTAQLSVFVRMVFTDFTVKEDFLALIPLKERTRGEDVYNAFKDFVREYKIPIHKIVSLTTDGAPAMIGVRSGFVALCRKDPDFPPFVNYHCVIHQQALAAKAIDMSHVMNVVVKIVNSIRAKALQHRLFKSLLDELDSAYGDLILHADVRWLSRGKVLQRFLDLLPEIITFLKSRNEEYEQLSDDAWLLDLGFLTDLTAKLNDLNRELQGKDRDIGHMISAVEAFKVKLSLWTTHLTHARLTHFPNLENVSQNLTDKTAFHPEQFCAHLNKLTSEFDRRFVEVQDMGQVVGFVSNPFLSIDIEQLSVKMQEVFTLPTGVDMEIIEIQSDIELKARARDQDFWSLVSREKYPLIVSCALKLKAYFGSTYLCEMAFSQMKIIKSKYRTRMTDAHLTDCLRLAITNYQPDFKRLADNVQSQQSH